MTTPDAKTDEQPQAQTPEDAVVIEFISYEDIPPEQLGKDNKVFHPDKQAVTMRRVDDPDNVLYFTEAEWDAFVSGVKDGEFDDLLDELPPEGQDAPQSIPTGG